MWLRWKVKVKITDFLRPHELYSPWNSPGQNTGVGSHCLLQGIFPTQGLNPGLPHCRQILYQLGHQGSPRILEWVAYPFSSRSSRPRNQTGVSCIAGGFFTVWATREARLRWGNVGKKKKIVPFLHLEGPRPLSPPQWPWTPYQPTWELTLSLSPCL